MPKNTLQLWPASDPAVSKSDFQGVSDVRGELQEKPGMWQCKLVETWSSVSLPFVFYYFKEMLVSKSKGFNHLACEGVVSLISYTLVLASFKKIFSALVSSVPVCSDQPFQRGMKAAFPHLKKERKKKSDKKKTEKIIAAPGF